MKLAKDINNLQKYLDEVKKSQNIYQIEPRSVPPNDPFARTEPNALTNRLMDFFRDGARSEAQPKVPTYEEVFGNKNFSLKDIESLIYALSLGISDPDDRKAFETIFTNWKNDQLSKKL